MPGPERWGTNQTVAALARQWLFEAAAQILENLLLALLDFEDDWFREPQLVSRRMNFASFQQDSPEVGYALLRKQHLIVGLDHISSSSTIPRFRKVRDV